MPWTKPLIQGVHKKNVFQTNESSALHCIYQVDNVNVQEWCWVGSSNEKREFLLNHHDLLCDCNNEDIDRGDGGSDGGLLSISQGNAGSHNSDLSRSTVSNSWRICLSYLEELWGHFLKNCLLQICSIQTTCYCFNWLSFGYDCCTYNWKVEILMPFFP